MAITIRAGRATAKIGTQLQKKLEAIVRNSHAAVVDEIEHIVKTINDRASAEWYEQVTRRDGSTGKLDYELRVSTTQVKGRVVSEDRRAYMVKRAGPTSLVTKPRGDGQGATFKGTVDDATYSQIMSEYRRTGVLPALTTAHERKAGRPTNVRAYRLNPRRSDGRNLWQELVNKPLRKYVRERAPHLAQALSLTARRA
jgi:hypothetical protein